MAVHKMILCIQLLVILHISRGFVLLTANIDDVRKLAMRFVSPDISKKISELLTLAATQVKNDHNIALEENLSKENKQYNHKHENRHGYRKDADIFGDLEGTSRYAPSLNITAKIHSGFKNRADDKSKTSSTESDDEINSSRLDEKEQTAQVKAVDDSREKDDLSAELNNTILVIESDNEQNTELNTIRDKGVLAEGRADVMNESKNADTSSSNDEEVNKKKTTS